MKAHVLQHVPFEGIGSIASWLSARNATIGFTRFFESPSLPETNKLDLLIIMGGPMGVDDEPTYSWLTSEKRFIREVIDRGVPTVGVCLGAQLIANSLGARVYASREKEIGCFDIESLTGDESDFRFPRKATTFHWHGETFDLSDNAVWPVIEKLNGRLVGHCGILKKEVDGKTERELVYVFARDTWAKGYATEAARALCQYAFDKLHLKCIIALIDPENVASAGVAKKAGLTFRGETVRPSGKRKHVYMKELVGRGS